MKDNLTIGLFTDTYLPQINGVTTLMPIMERILRDQGHEVFVFAPSYDSPRWSQESEHLFRFPAFKFAFHKESRVTIPFHADARAAFKRLDVIHSQTPFSLGWLAIQLSRRYKVPHLHTYHTLFTEYLHYFPKYLRPSTKLVGKVSHAFCNGCDAVSVPSTPMKEELRSYGITLPIYLLPFGLDMDDFAHEPKIDLYEALNLDRSDRVLLCTGRLSAEKNVDFVLRSFEKIAAEEPNSKLVIVGDGPARADLEHLAADLHLSDRVIFTGYVAWKDLIDYYKQADLFVYGSKTETQGIVFMEAMASGLPVVAIGEMGALEAVHHDKTGILVEEDEDQFARAALDLVNDEARFQVFAERSLVAAKDLSIQSSITTLLEIYNEMISKRAVVKQQA